jgi:hypothetical protein
MLLASAGHGVLFVQRPKYPWQPRRKEESGVEGVELTRLNQLIHHRLRLLRGIHSLNARFETSQLRRMPIGVDDVVVNFNYDYFFIRQAFPRNRIVSIINDAHWLSRDGHEWQHQLWALRRTLLASDACLTVSEPLQRRLSAYRPVGIFRPWASSDFQAIDRSGSPTELLYWGYINERLDFGFIERLAVGLMASRPHLRLVFVGPIRCRLSLLQPLRALSNVSFRPATPLHDLDLRNTRASIIPFKKQGYASVEFHETTNKFFQLVARGLPVLITGMPNFHRAPFVFRLDAADRSPEDVIDHAWRELPDLEASMRRCVSENSADRRLSQLMEVIAELGR